jgi:hypothetical protein
MYVQLKLQFQAVLDQVFPDYRGIFGDLYSRVSLYNSLSNLRLLQPFYLLEKRIISCLCQSRSDRWAGEKATLIVAAAANNPFRK